MTKRLFSPKANYGDRDDGVTGAIPHSPDNQYHPFILRTYSAGYGGYEFVPAIDKEGKTIPGIYEFLPVLVRYKRKPGHAGIPQVRENQAYDDSEAIAREVKRGWFFIDHRALPYVVAFNQQMPSYSVEYAQGARGKIFTDAWQMPVVIGRKTQWRFDRVGWHLFRRSLLEYGIVQLPSEDAFDVRGQLFEDRAGRGAERQHIPAVKAKSDTAAAAASAISEGSFLDRVLSGKTHHTGDPKLVLPGIDYGRKKARKYRVMDVTTVAPVSSPKLVDSASHPIADDDEEES